MKLIAHDSVSLNDHRISGALRSALMDAVRGDDASGRSEAASEIAHELDANYGLAVDPLALIVEAQEFAATVNAYKRHTKGKVSVKPEFTSGRALLEAVMPDITHLSRPWVSEGLTILAGRPKLGKTTLARQIALAVGSGLPVWGSSSIKTPVLFLSLEEGARLMKKKLVSAGVTPEQADAIDFAWKWPRGLEGVEHLRDYLKEHLSTKFVIVDSLTRFRDSQTKDKPQFVQDYDALSMLAELCKEFPGLSIIVLHHTTKLLNADDPIADITGSYGLAAAADNFMVLRKQGADYFLFCGGRYWDEDADGFVLDRAGGCWSLRGVHDGVSLTAMQSKYLQHLAGHPEASTRSVAAAMDVRDSTASELLGELAAKGVVIREGRGWNVTTSGRLKVSTHTHTESSLTTELPKVPKQPKGKKESFGSFGVSDGLSPDGVPL